MKKLSEIRISVKMRALISALAMAALLVSRLLNDSPVGTVLIVATFVLTMIPFFLKQDVRDELARENEMKAMRVTLGAVYVFLLIVQMVDFSASTMQFSRTFFSIALCAFLILQNLMTVFYEVKGGFDKGEDA